MNEVTTTPASGTAGGGRTAWWIALGALILVAVGLWIWKGIAVDRADDRLDAAREQWREETRQALAERTRTLLSLSAEPLGLAVRDAAMEENWGVLGSYLDRVARAEGVQRVVFVARDTVRVATDASLEGRPAAGVVPAAAATAEAAGVTEADGAFHAAVPITGLNERIGVLVLTYVPPETAFDAPAADDDAAE